MGGLILFFCLFPAFHMAAAGVSWIPNVKDSYGPYYGQQGQAAQPEATAHSCMYFAEQSDKDCVIVNGPQKPMSEVCVSLHFISHLTAAEYSLLSIATQQNYNAFLIFPMHPNKMCISVANKDYIFDVDNYTNTWTHMVCSWSCKTGMLQMWMNGKRYKPQVTASRSPIGAPQSIVLGQEQDEYGGGFDKKQSHAGEMCGVQIWSTPLSPAMMKAILDGDCTMRGNYWGAGNGASTVNGSVIMNDQLCPQKKQEANCCCKAC